MRSESLVPDDVGQQASVPNGAPEHGMLPMHDGVRLRNLSFMRWPARAIGWVA